MLSFSIMYPQDIDDRIRNQIVDDALQGFLSSLAYMNDKDDVKQPVEIARKYTDTGGCVLLVNDHPFDGSLKDALTKYRDKIMLDFDTNHILDEESTNVSLDDGRLRIYRVKSNVIRTRNCRDDIYGDRDYTDIIPITFLVRYMPQSDRKVVITSIDCKMPDDTNRKIGYMSRYVFRLDNELPTYIKIPYQGIKRIDDSDIKAISFLETYAVYGDGRKVLEKQDYQNYKIIVDSLSEDEKGVKYVKIPFNENTKKRLFELRYRQEGSSLSFNLTLEQEGRPRRGFLTYDDYGNRIMLAYHYNLEQPFGLSIMSKLSDKSRFLLGALVMIHFPPSSWGQNDQEPKVITSAVVNDYRVIQTFYGLSTVKYSNLMDPNGIAKTKYANGTFLANSGIMINNYLMAEIGLGAAFSKKFHQMDTAYNLTVTSYEPLYDSLPDISPIYDYTGKTYDFSYAEKANWSFASRIGLRSGLYLGGKYSKTYLTGGVGFSFVPSISRLSTFDFNIGISYNM